jgi:sporulation protein YlmC with PRC-barrel domain
MTMDLYAIRRRDGWTTPEQLQETGARSAAEGDKAGSGVRWIRSYVVNEDNGDLGTVCIYEADSPETIRVHAQRVGMPADEITPVGDTVIVRPDPVAAAA